MKNNTLLRGTLALLAATALYQTTPAFAQAPAGGGAPAAGGQGGGRRGGGGPMANMSDEQREALRQIATDNRELTTKLTEARKELGGAIYAETVNEGTIREKSAAVAKIEADLAVARAKGFAKVRDKFTAEQIDAMKNMPGGFGGRGGGGGGAGGAGGGGANRRPPGGAAAQ